MQEKSITFRNEKPDRIRKFSENKEIKTRKTFAIKVVNKHLLIKRE
jgi:hypothetical protein